VSCANAKAGMAAIVIVVANVWMAFIEVSP
jgi:hypothetical protein